MSKISNIVDQLLDGNDVPAPELDKVVIRVRSGGDILPPSWLMPTAPSRHLEPSKK